uniref:Putative secreted protein n=1 Tax=Ixodes ricinus TaxID=34613 RepID=A0A6B0U9P6_IXORI
MVALRLSLAWFLSTGWCHFFRAGSMAVSQLSVPVTLVSVYFHFVFRAQLLGARFHVSRRRPNRAKFCGKICCHLTSTPIEFPAKYSGELNCCCGHVMSIPR